MLSLSFIVTLPLADLFEISPIKIAPNLNQPLRGKGAPCLKPPDNYSSTQFFQAFKEKYSIMAKSFSSYFKSTYIANNIVCKRIVS